MDIEDARKTLRDGGLPVISSQRRTGLWIFI
jgi:hypothetical protein